MKETHEILSRPFEKELIKNRPGPGGKPLQYVSGAEYIKRLNEAFKLDWSFDIIEFRILEHEVMVLGEITIGSIKKKAFGGSSISMHQSKGTPISIADDLKSAATDALKKCSSMLGIGLHLYTDPPEDPPQSNTHQPNQPRSKLTDRQANAIHAIARNSGMNREQLLEAIRIRYKKETVDHLSKSEASDFIAYLK